MVVAQQLGLRFGPMEFYSPNGYIKRHATPET
jgi:hypothetical protein